MRLLQEAEVTRIKNVISDKGIKKASILKKMKFNDYSYRLIMLSKKPISDKDYNRLITFINNHDKIIILKSKETSKIREAIKNQKDSYKGLCKILKISKHDIHMILASSKKISRKDYLIMMDYAKLKPTIAINNILINNNKKKKTENKNSIFLSQSEATEIKNFLSNHQISYSRFCKKIKFNKHSFKAILQARMRIKISHYKMIKEKIEEIKNGEDLRFITPNELYIIKNILQKSSFSRKTLAKVLNLEEDTIINMTNNRETLSEVFIERVFSGIRILFKDPIINIIEETRFLTDKEIKFINDRITGNQYKKNKTLKACELTIDYEVFDKLLSKKITTTTKSIEDFISKIKHLPVARILDKNIDNKRYLTDKEIKFIKDRYKGSTLKREELLKKIGLDNTSVNLINSLIYKSVKKSDEFITNIMNSIKALPIIDSKGNIVIAVNEKKKEYRYLTDKEIALIKKGYKGSKTERMNFIEKYKLDITVKYMNLLIKSDIKMNINDINILMEKIPFKEEKIMKIKKRRLTKKEVKKLKEHLYVSPLDSTGPKEFLSRFGLEYKVMYRMIYHNQTFSENEISEVLAKVDEIPTFRYFTDKEIAFIRARFNGNGNRKIKLLKEINSSIDHSTLSRMMYRGKKTTDLEIKNIINDIEKLPISSPNDEYYETRTITTSEYNLISLKIHGSTEDKKRILKENNIGLSYERFYKIVNGQLKLTNSQFKSLMNSIKVIPILPVATEDIEYKPMDNNEIIDIKEEKLIYTYKGKEYTFLEKQSDSLIQYQEEWFETVMYTNDSGLKFYRSTAEFYSKFRLKTQ